MKTDEIKWRILNDTAENVVKWIAEKDKRIEQLEADIKEAMEWNWLDETWSDAMNKLTAKYWGEQE